MTLNMKALNRGAFSMKNETRYQSVSKIGREDRITSATLTQAPEDPKGGDRIKSTLPKLLIINDLEFHQSVIGRAGS